MNKKSKYFLIIFIGLAGLLLSELTILNMTKSSTKLEITHKNSFVSLTAMPDLAIYSDVSYIRHRSFASVGTIYQNDGILKEYEYGSFIYNHTLLKKNMR